MHRRVNQRSVKDPNYATHNRSWRRLRCGCVVRRNPPRSCASPAMPAAQRGDPRIKAGRSRFGPCSRGNAAVVRSWGVSPRTVFPTCRNASMCGRRGIAGRSEGRERPARKPSVAGDVAQQRRHARRPHLALDFVKWSVIGAPAPLACIGTHPVGVIRRRRAGSSPNPLARRSPLAACRAVCSLKRPGIQAPARASIRRSSARWRVSRRWAASARS